MIATRAKSRVYGHSTSGQAVVTNDVDHCTFLYCVPFTQRSIFDSVVRWDCNLYCALAYPLQQCCILHMQHSCDVTDSTRSAGISTDVWRNQWMVLGTCSIKKTTTVSIYLSTYLSLFAQTMHNSMINCQQYDMSRIGKAKARHWQQSTIAYVYNAYRGKRSWVALMYI